MSNERDKKRIAYIGSVNPATAKKLLIFVFQDFFFKFEQDTVNWCYVGWLKDSIIVKDENGKETEEHLDLDQVKYFCDNWKGFKIKIIKE